MYAVEFKAKIENGVIAIPRRLKSMLTDTVKVIVLKDDFGKKTIRETSRGDAIDRLLATPLSMPDFKPLSRKEIYNMQDGLVVDGKLRITNPF